MSTTRDWAVRVLLAAKCALKRDGDMISRYNCIRDADFGTHRPLGDSTSLLLTAKDR